MPPPAVRFSRAQRLVYHGLVLLLFQLVGFIVLAGVEIPIALLLSQDFNRFGISYEQWQVTHLVLTIVLEVAALAGGLLVGRRWWRQLNPPTTEVPPYRPPIQYV